MVLSTLLNGLDINTDINIFCYGFQVQFLKFTLFYVLVSVVNHSPAVHRSSSVSSIPWPCHFSLPMT